MSVGPNVPVVGLLPSMSILFLRPTLVSSAAHLTSANCGHSIALSSVNVPRRVHPQTGLMRVAHTMPLNDDDGDDDNDDPPITRANMDANVESNLDKDSIAFSMTLSLRESWLRHIQPGNHHSDNEEPGSIGYSTHSGDFWHTSRGFCEKNAYLGATRHPSCSTKLRSSSHYEPFSTLLVRTNPAFDASRKIASGFTPAGQDILQPAVTKHSVWHALHP